MRKFKALTATTNPDQTDPFTKENLKDFLGLPIEFRTITIDFDNKNPIGKVISSYIDNEKVFVVGKIKEGFDNFFIVPGGTTEKNSKNKIINLFAATMKPSDTSLTPLEYVENWPGDPGETLTKLYRDIYLHKQKYGTNPIKMLIWKDVLFKLNSEINEQNIFMKFKFVQLGNDDFRKGEGFLKKFSGIPIQVMEDNSDLSWILKKRTKEIVWSDKDSLKLIFEIAIKIRKSKLFYNDEKNSRRLTDLIAISGGGGKIFMEENNYTTDEYIEKLKSDEL